MVSTFCLVKFFLAIFLYCVFYYRSNKGSVYDSMTLVPTDFKKINLEKIELETVKFLKQELESMMKKLSENFDKLDNKIRQMRSFQSAFLTFLASGILSGFHKKLGLYCSTSLWIIIIGALLCTIFCGLGSKESNFETLTFPSEFLFKDKNCKNEFKNSIWSQIKLYEKKIENGTKVFKKKEICFNLAIEFSNTSYWLAMFMLFPLGKIWVFFGGSDFLTH